MSAAPAPSALRSDGRRPRAHVPERTTRQFRTDIQALRAIAVVFVVVYHLVPHRLSGGYIGVDVFFVISGYLITSHLVREAARTGRVRLGAFWAARARRILPASLVAIAVTIAVTAWWAPVTLFDDLRRHALGSILYVENWMLAADAVDYSAADNQASPFQHVWSLSVEEQFYLFWPLIVVLGIWLTARTSRSRPGRRTRLPRILLALFGVVVAASLVHSIVVVADGQANAYFLTTTRVWELGAGGMLAVIGFRRLSRPWRLLLAYAGLTAIAVSAAILTNESPFPGLAALPVIAGTMALILAGTPARGEDRVDLGPIEPWSAVSRWTVTQWLGDRSYSLYLWHFPVIIVWTMLLDRKPGYFDLIGMLVLSFVLAELSYRFVEQPVRRAPLLSGSTRRSLWGALVAMALVAGLTFAYPIVGARGEAHWDRLADVAQSQPTLGAETAEDDRVVAFSTSRVAMTPSPLDADEDLNRVFSAAECVGDTMSPTTPVCTRGDDEADVSIALVGDSHARMYSTAFAEVVDAEGWHLRTYLHNACPFNPVPREREVEGTVVCTEPNADVMAELLADPPDVVVTTWFITTPFTADGSRERNGAVGFAEYWNELEDAGSQVVVLRDVPLLNEDAPDCVAANYDDPDVCATPRDEALRGESMLGELTELAPRVTIADFTDLFCTDDLCKPVIGNVLAYKDRHHITDTYAVSMVPDLTAQVKRALADR